MFSREMLIRSWQINFFGKYAFKNDIISYSQKVTSVSNQNCPHKGFLLSYMVSYQPFASNLTQLLQLNNTTHFSYLFQQFVKLLRKWMQFTYFPSLLFVGNFVSSISPADTCETSVLWYCAVRTSSLPLANFTLHLGTLSSNDTHTGYARSILLLCCMGN